MAEANVVKKVLELTKAGASNRQVGRDLNIPETTIRNIRKRAAQEQTPAVIFHDKKIGGIDWRESIAVVKGMQKLKKDASWSQIEANISCGDGKTPVAIMQLSDTHIGAAGTDYTLFEELTDLIINTPNLYFTLNGDEVEMAIKLRGVAEVCAQILDPGAQVEFVESWIRDVKHKLLWATWSNHSTMRAEQAIGFCPVKGILAKEAPFFSGIGHPNVHVGNQTYKMAVNHKFQGVTAADVTAGCKKYLRTEAPDREIAIQGDAHRAGISIYNEGGQRRIAVCSGTLNTSSGFAQRHFSVLTSSAFPVLQLFSDKHQIIPYMSIGDYMAATSQSYFGRECKY